MRHPLLVTATLLSVALNIAMGIWILVFLKHDPARQMQELQVQIAQDQYAALKAQAAAAEAQSHEMGHWTKLDTSMIDKDDKVARTSPAAPTAAH